MRKDSPLIGACALLQSDGDPTFTGCATRDGTDGLNGYTSLISENLGNFRLNQSRASLCQRLSEHGGYHDLVETLLFHLIVKYLGEVLE
jgi:hypothetical protein